MTRHWDTGKAGDGVTMSIWWCTVSPAADSSPRKGWGQLSSAPTTGAHLTLLGARIFSMIHMPRSHSAERHSRSPPDLSSRRGIQPTGPKSAP